ncbi:DUF523 and DUF1722 domain-containing protein [Nocardiopsis sp. HNM0947]|uniref:DUF523 and DUF1722 domain-containing protein n=1 Tax=Nocardiopsis coralli TaxID=2772213 RepID=A0ABR9P4H7_9ACTN|nr:DUF523 and DUF1722 domain-containing protein [Nocardiopsis coralli]MBE2998753.1 DUF523 and DUF1722 domain-containing protein [Nocardiopsis coralli]
MKPNNPPETTNAPRPLVGVSSCLLGAPVRHNGGHSRHRFLTDELDRFVDWLPVCPEAEIGLGTPRPTLRLRRREEQDRVVSNADGADHTDALASIADQHLDRLREADGYVLKNKSPSCGLFALPVAGEEGQRVSGSGRGAFADRLTRLLPSLPVEEQGRLMDASLREWFVERVFAHARLRTLFAGDWRPKDLVDFHTRHKLQLMAHSPEGYRETGRLVARAGERPRQWTEEAYTAAFHRALAVRTSRGKHANALQHAFGMLSPLLDDGRRHDLLASIEDYRQERAPLSLPTALLRHHCGSEEVPWARDQTYLRPYPDDLRLRHAVAV